MTAYPGVLAAAALTTLVAGCVAAALAVFGGQALPLAAGHDLTTAPGTSLAASGPASADQLTADGQQLRRLIAAALPGTPLGFYQAQWSDPLGLVPGALPAAPRSAGQGNIPILEAAALGGVAGHAVLVAGTWPAQASAPTTTGPPVPAALPASAATLLHVAVGDTLTFKDRVSGTSARFRVVGLFAQRPATGSAVRTGDPFWGLDTIPAAGYSTLGGFATYGPLVVDGGAFGSVLPVYRGSWLAQPDLALLPDGQFGATAGRLDDLRQSLSSSATLGGMTITTSLPTVLRDIAQGLAVARSLLVISALQLLLLAAAALLATSRLLVSQREGESALLAARGADRWQLARLTAAEVVPLSLVTALAGGLAGTWLATALTRSGPLRDAGLRLPGLLGGSGADALVAVAVVALCAIGALLGPAISAGTGTARPGAALAGRGRQGTAAGFTRAGADVGLVLLAVAAGWELHRYSAVSDIAGTGGTAGLDPVLALAPALALAGGTVAMLRLLPGAARLADRLAGRARGLTTALAGWQFSRQPLRSGGAALLIVMAVATGTLALAQHESWDRSVADQAAFTAGTSTRLDLPLPLPAGQAGSVAGGAPAMAVSVQTQAVPALLAVQASQGARVASLRGDEAASPAALFGAITPRDTPGSVLPGQPASIRLTATLAAP
ncbi:MAG TPA: FtsX-like permease family protein, partial [Trebonia sp.]|nr:FtsX-like permease family protein [Trebonia sp.]